jgi:thiol-disulfide isomerase/thioredoxin
MNRIFTLLSALAIALPSAASERTAAKSKGQNKSTAAVAPPSAARAAAAPTPAPAPAPMRKSDLPPFSLPDLDGKVHSSAEFAGKPVVVDFWATWCAACKETVPHLTELQEKYGSRGLTVIGISVDKGSAEKIRKAAKKLGINYLVLHDKENALAQSFGFTGIPSLYVYDRAGGLLRSMPGYDAGQEDRLTATALQALED